ncbi:hypothetical protein HKBW3C_02477, partial [Candidatus Hakubella thermalkaliphila]
KVSEGEYMFSEFVDRMNAMVY